MIAGKQWFNRMTVLNQNKWRERVAEHLVLNGMKAKHPVLCLMVGYAMVCKQIGWLGGGMTVCAPP
jgi:hypothetical protein